MPGKNPGLDPRMNGQVVSGAELNQFEYFSHNGLFCDRLDCSGDNPASQKLNANYDVATLCSLSTLFRTDGRFIMRSCQAV